MFFNQLFGRLFGKPSPEPAKADQSSDLQPVILTNFSLAVPSFFEKMRMIRTEAARGRKEHWDFKDLREALKASTILAEPLLKAPRSVDLSSCARTISTLEGMTRKDGLERAKFGFIDTESGKFIWGLTSTGTNMQVVITPIVQAKFADLKIVPVCCFHTHPTGWGTERAHLHFSRVDIESFISDPLLHISIVTGRGEALVMLKTADTEFSKPGVRAHSREDLEAIRARLTGLEKKMERMSSFGSDGARVFTKFACKAMGITLYYMNMDDWKAREIELVSRRKSA